MADKRLYTEASVAALAPGSELVLAKGDVATPSALDRAFERGIRVRWASERGGGGATGALEALLAADGSYVVEVAGGRARVFRLAEGGPVLVGAAALGGTR
jgi:hypothetical protein